MSLFPKINLGIAVALPCHDHLGKPCKRVIFLRFLGFQRRFASRVGGLSVLLVDTFT
jgi:hypothetical protein